MTSFQHKYKPISLTEFVFPCEYSAQAIRQWIEASGTRPLLLYGEHGIGKTTLAKLLFSELYPDLNNTSAVVNIEPDCSEGRGPVIQRLNNIASVNWLPFGSKKLIIIDEIDSAPGRLQRQLRLYLDKHAASAHHIFATNYLERLDTGIRSRSLQVELGPPNVEGWKQRANEILINENVNPLSDDELRELIRLANGSCREILQLLESYVLAERCRVSAA